MRSKLSRLALAAALLPTTSYADNLGPWEDEGTFFSQEIYVSYDNGIDTAPSLGLIPSAPVATITRALDIANQFFLNGGIAVTINVEPGTPVIGPGGVVLESGEYDPDHGEVFPITLPAFGVALEASAPGVIIDGEDLMGASANTALSVPVLGDDSLPPSAVKGLRIQGVDLGMSISLRMAPAGETPVELQVRDCEFIDCCNGISIFNPEERFSEMVFERNLLTGSVRLDDGIVEISCGKASNLYRQNDISNYEFALEVDHFGSPEDNRARIFSNTIQLAVNCVNLIRCNPVVAHNTIAYAVDFGGDPTVTGVQWSGGTELRLFNNIIYCPLAGSGATTAADFFAASGLVISAGNAIEDDGDPLPFFVSGNLHPGLLNPVNLHLAANSPMIGFGDFTQVTGSPEGPLALVYGDPATGQRITRADVAADIDGDPRVAYSSPSEMDLQCDAGSDEVTQGTLLSLAAAANQDALGNISRDSNGDHLMTFTATGPAGQPFGALLSSAFFDDIPGMNLRNGALYSNTLFPGIGNFMLETRGGLNGPAIPTLLTFSGAVGSGTGTGSFTYNLGQVSDAKLEAELYFQLFTVDTGGHILLSNRVAVELNP